MSDETVNVRYMVDDVASAIDFYTTYLGFTVQTDTPAFADVRRGHLRLLLSGPESSAGRPMPTGRSPLPAGGTGSTSSPPISRVRSIGCAVKVSGSATTSSPAPAAPRSSSRIRRAT
jgi:catechol 2,3-dioxygenase-like lactoylglutathione lyase family enzyme